jgi:protein-tyrosine phosphatase
MPTRHRTIPADRSPGQAVLDEAREVLASGGLVAMATETVYGIAARADLPAALERLAALKGRASEQAFTWHVASPAPLRAFQELPATIERLASRYWPGPLTLVLRGVPPGLERVARGGWTGIRLPAHESTRAVLEACPFPVVMTSANVTGEPPLVAGAAVHATFQERVDLVLDAGTARIGESSTVLRLGRGEFEVLREGLITIADLRRAAGLALAFVCTGNTCRSPMAEGLARKLIAERLGTDPSRVGEFGFEVLSAGVQANVGLPAAGAAVEVLRGEGIDLSSHWSRPASLELMASLDRIYGMTRAHVDALAMTLPPLKQPELDVLDPEGVDIPDPIGGSEADYRDCAARIRAALERRVEQWV